MHFCARRSGRASSTNYWPDRKRPAIRLNRHRTFAGRRRKRQASPKQSVCSNRPRARPGLHGRACVYRKGAKSPEAAVEVLEQTVLAAAERLGGAKYLRENKGHFWGLAETRPYMRAKSALAEAYQDADRQLDAIAEYEHMLELCPGDNMGIRYVLLGRYIRVERFHRAKRLMKQYGNEDSTIFLYGRLFVEILSEEFGKAKRTLKRARAETGTSTSS